MPATLSKPYRQNIRNLLRATWRTLHEPRVVTFVVVLFYALSAIFGLLLIIISMTDRSSWIPDSVTFVVGFMLVLMGILGVPSAWSGRWWFERGVTMLTSSTGLLIMVATLIAFMQHPVALDLPIAWAAAFCGFCMQYVGINRWFRIGRDPYAPGKGPQLACRRIERAEMRMAEIDSIAKANTIRK